MSAELNDFSGIMTFTAPTGGVTVKTMLDIGGLIVYPMETADAAASFQGHILNAHIGKLITGALKTASQAWTVGAVVYYDISADEYTTVATGNNFAGWAYSAAASGAALISGDVIPGYGTVLA